MSLLIKNIIDFIFTMVFFPPLFAGIHYIGKMDPSFENRVLMDQLTGGRVEYPLMDEAYDIVSESYF